MGLGSAPAAVHNTRGTAAPLTAVAIRRSPMAVALHTGDKGSAPAAHNTRGKAASVGAGAVQAMNLTRPDARSARPPYPGLFPLRKPSAQRRLGRREAPTTEAGVGCAPAADASGSSSQPKRSWLAGSDNGSRQRLCPTRYLSRSKASQGVPRGDTPQTEAQGQKPETVRRLTRLVDRRGRPPGPGGVRGAWEMAPRSRSAAQAPVKTGSPERVEEGATVPTKKGQRAHRRARPIEAGRRRRRRSRRAHRRQRKNRRWVPTKKGRRGEKPVKPGSPERVEEGATVPTAKGRRGQPGPTGKKGRTDGRSRPRRDIHKLGAQAMRSTQKTRCAPLSGPSKKLPSADSPMRTPLPTISRSC